MKVHLQPPEITADGNDPFQNDMLDRKRSVEILTSLVANLEGPCTLAIDAAWGHGKTTFLKIWTAHLRKQGFPVVGFNAWETDYSGNPFIALSTELTEGLQKSADNSLSMKIRQLKKQAAKVAPWVVPLAVQGGSMVNPVVGAFLAPLGSWFKNTLSVYEKNQQSIKAFRHTLRDMAKTLSESAGSRPLIVMIDELDRCRPSYAVQLLEVAKHLFPVNHIVFVLAVNRSELAHSVKALYGSDFDAEGYLRRFFDADFRLPHPDRVKFIDSLLKSRGISDYFDQTQDKRGKEEQPKVAKMLKAFFQAPDLSLRRIAQAIRRLELVLASLPNDQPAFADAAVVALIIRTIDVDLYYDFFVRDGSSDLDVSNKIFGRYEARELRLKQEGQWFDAKLIEAFREREYRKSGNGNVTSPLFQSYKQSTLASPAGGIAKSVPAEIANALQIAESETSRTRYMFTHEFKAAVERLELLSEDFVAEPLAER